MAVKPGRRPPPARPDPARIAKLAALGDLHDQWIAANADKAGFDPHGRPKKSDYNIHNADIDPDPAAAADFAAEAAKIFAGGAEGS